MDRWEALQTEVNKRLTVTGEELAVLIKEAKDDALASELAKLNSTLAKIDARLATVEAKLEEGDD